MIVELGKRVDDKIWDTYLRNCEVGADSGVTLRKLSEARSMKEADLVLTVSETSQQQSWT
jgi:hypothetical protein